MSLLHLCSADSLVQNLHTWQASLLQASNQLIADWQLCPSTCSICQPAFVIIASHLHCGAGTRHCCSEKILQTQAAASSLLTTWQ